MQYGMRASDMSCMSRDAEARNVSTGEVPSDRVNRNLER